MKGKVELSVEELRRKAGMANARMVLEKFGKKAFDELLIMMGAVDPKFALYFEDEIGKLKKGDLELVKGGRRHDQIEQDLKDLGINLYRQPQLEIVEFKIESPHFEFFRLNLGNLPKYSEKELMLLLAKDFPDIKIRKEIIELFFEGNGFASRIAISIVDVLRKIDEIIKPNHSSKFCENVINIGETFEEVQILKNKRNISSSFPENSKFQLKKIPQKNVPQSEEKIDRQQYVSHQRKKLEEFVKSVFCFCIVQLSQNAEAIAWVAEPEKLSLKIPDWVQEKMALIKSISQYYDFIDYSVHFKATLRAFLRVYKGVN